MTGRYWQEDWDLPANTSLAQFSRVLDHVLDQLPEDPGGPDPDLAALDEIDGLQDGGRLHFQRDALDWLGGAA